jgi:hypothetical protein
LSVPFEETTRESRGIDEGRRAGGGAQVWVWIRATSKESTVDDTGHSVTGVEVARETSEGEFMLE